MRHFARCAPLLTVFLSALLSDGQSPSLEERIQGHPARPRLAPGQDAGEEVWFPGGNHTLRGFLYKPKGGGPFPALIWNHGSEKTPGPQPELAAFYNSRGFVFFIPLRRGHGGSPGEYIVDVNSRLLIEHKDNREAAWKAMVALHDQYNLDVAAAVEWLKSRPFVARNRIVMSGVSYGGIQTLLSAEKGMGVRGFISFAPAAMSWRILPLRKRLKNAVKNAKAPVFLLQAKNDYSTGPSEVLGPEIVKKGPPNRARLYPAFGADDDHRKGHAAFATWNIGIETWGEDVMAFIAAVLDTP
jgi:dienelactone hydrolase